MDACTSPTDPKLMMHRRGMSLWDRIHIALMAFCLASFKIEKPDLPDRSSQKIQQLIQKIALADCEGKSKHAWTPFTKLDYS